MAPLFFHRALLAATALFSIFSASDAAARPHYFDLSRRAETCPTCPPSQVVGTGCSKFFIGQKDTGSSVCVTVSGSNLVVTYPTITGVTYNTLHLWIGTSIPTKQNPGTAPGKFPYNSYCTAATKTCTIPLSVFGGTCDIDFYIITHAAVTVTSGGTTKEETGYGGTDCIVPSCNPWATYWKFKLLCVCLSTSDVYYTITSTSTAFVTDTIYLTGMTTETTYSTGSSTSTSYSTGTTTETIYETITLTNTLYDTITSTDTFYDTITSTDTLYDTITSTDISFSTETNYETLTSTSTSSTVVTSTCHPSA